MILTGYEIFPKPIYESNRSLVYKGIKKNKNLRVILKLLKSSAPSNSELARYEQEYKIIQSLKNNHIIQSYELIKNHQIFVGDKPSKFNTIV